MTREKTVGNRIGQAANAFISYNEKMKTGCVHAKEEVGQKEKRRKTLDFTAFVVIAEKRFSKPASSEYWL